MKYSTHKYPCIDKYPQGEEFITNEQMLSTARQQLKQQGLQGKLNTMNVYKDLKAAFLVSAIWEPEKYPVIGIHFMDGTETQKAWVRDTINSKLVPLVNQIQFQWNVPRDVSHIRISFALPGQAWSTVGTDALKVGMNEPTMNLGWLDDDTSYGSEAFKGTGQVVLHEFGHAIGMIHEHQNPKNNPIEWNKPVVYEELYRTNSWDQQTTDHNMFKKYGDAQLCQQATDLPPGPERRVEMQNYCSGELINGSEYDVTSIMHYFYPQSWIVTGPKMIPVNTKFSPLDKKWIRKYYGFPVKEELEDEPIETTINETDGETIYTLLFKDNNKIIITMDKDGLTTVVIDEHTVISNDKDMTEMNETKSERDDESVIVRNKSTQDWLKTTEMGLITAYIAGMGYLFMKR